MSLIIPKLWGNALRKAYNPPINKIFRKANAVTAIRRQPFFGKHSWRGVDTVKINYRLSSK